MISNVDSNSIISDSPDIDVINFSSQDEPSYIFMMSLSWVIKSTKRSRIPLPLLDRIVNSHSPRPETFISTYRPVVL